MSHAKYTSFSSRHPNKASTHSDSEKVGMVFTIYPSSNQAVELAMRINTHERAPRK